jgi:tRNA(Ile)-lysidine synthase
MGDRVHEVVRQQGTVLQAGRRVIVGVSGGQDSCALLHALWSLREELGIYLVAAHLHHGMRGDAADADAAFVADLCERLAVPLTVRRTNVPASAHRMHASDEEAGRRARHELFRELAGDDPRALIALGHTSDDRAETVLLNILRGSGIDGLAAMPAVDGRIVRPLLGLRRQDTADYCARHGIAYRHDATNDSLHHRRNRLRLDLIPRLERDYNARVRDALLRLAELAADDCATLHRLACEIVDAAAVSGNGIALSTTALLAVDRSIVRRAIREAILRVKGDLVDVGWSTVERIMQKVSAVDTGARAWSCMLPSAHVRLRLTGLVLHVETVPALHDTRPIACELPNPGSVTVSEWGVRFVCELLASPADATAGRDDTWVALDAAAVQGTLIVRNRRRGDRIRAVGQPGTRKLQDIFVDRKVPRAERDRVPIVADSEGIVWIVGHALAERAAPSAERPVIVIGIEDA